MSKRRAGWSPGAFKTAERERPCRGGVNVRGAFDGGYDNGPVRTAARPPAAQKAPVRLPPPKSRPSAPLQLQKPLPRLDTPAPPRPPKYKLWRIHRSRRVMMFCSAPHESPHFQMTP
jgi:hypothetical protein